MNRTKKNGSLLPRLARIESKCDRILRRLPDSTGMKPVDDLIDKMRDAAFELQKKARSDIEHSGHGF